MKDVKVSIVEKKGGCSRTNIGDYFIIKGGKLHIPFTQGICYYALSSLMPVLAPWQMEEDANDHFILKFKEFVCPMGNVIYKAEQFDNLELKDG